MPMRKVAGLRLLSRTLANAAEQPQTTATRGALDFLLTPKKSLRVAGLDLFPGLLGDLAFILRGIVALLHPLL